MWFLIFCFIFGVIIGLLSYAFSKSVVNESYLTSSEKVSQLHWRTLLLGWAFVFFSIGCSFHFSNELNVIQRNKFNELSERVKKLELENELTRNDTVFIAQKFKEYE